MAKDDDTYDVFCVVDNCVNDENAWIMDSSASQHMTPNRNWFETYEPSSRKVLMRNNQLCKVAGVGFVKIKFTCWKDTKVDGCETYTRFE